VTRGQLPQRAGLPGLNGGGAAAAVPPNSSGYPRESFRACYVKSFGEFEPALVDSALKVT